MASSSAHVRAGVPQAELSRRVAGVVPDAVAALPAGEAPVLVDGRFGFLGFVFAPAIALQLERRDVEAVLPPGDTGAGPQRAHSGEVLRAHLLVAPATHIPALEQRPELRMVAYDGSMTLEQLRQRVAAGEAVDDDEALAVFMQPLSAGAADR
jgi:hypothetical protein